MDIESEEILSTIFEKALPHRIPFDCGPGWKGIIGVCLSKLTPFCTESMYVCQIKEKYGELRIYLTTGTDEMFRICEDALKQSLTVCERCGEPGKLYAGKWYVTRCESCIKVERNKEIIIRFDD